MADQHSGTPAPAPSAPRSFSPEPEATANVNMNDAPASITTDSPPPARGWWLETAHTTQAWAKLIAALDLTTEKAALLLAAKPVETALWHYDERFLQPRLKRSACAIAAQAQGNEGIRRPRHQPTEHEELVRYVIPLGSAAYTMRKSAALWEDHFWGVEERLRSEAYRGVCQDVHASFACWRILCWLRTDEAKALGLDHLFVDEKDETNPDQWGQAQRVPGVMLEYLYDFEAETSG